MTVCSPFLRILAQALLESATLLASGQPNQYPEVTQVILGFCLSYTPDSVFTGLFAWLLEMMPIAGINAAIVNMLTATNLCYY